MFSLQASLPASDVIDAENVVIGSGPGGALTACLLAEAGKRVLLVEEGPLFSQASCKQFSLEEMVTKYRHGGITFAAGRPNISYVEGRCVGGGSEINACLYHRTPEEVLSEWRDKYLVASLNAKDLESFFEANERELRVTYFPEDLSPAALKLREGASCLGWEAIEVPHLLNVQNDSTIILRQSMTETFLPRFMAASGNLLANTRAIRIEEKFGKSVWQITAELGAKRRIFINAKNIFLAAGAIQTPALLRRSGITQNIGNSLRLHPTIKVVAEFSEAVNGKNHWVSRVQVKKFSPRYSFGSSLSSLPYMATALLNYPGQLQEIENNWQRMTIYYVMITGGAGIVRCPPLFSAPFVRYQVGIEGLRALSEGLKQLCRLLLAAGAKALYPTLTGIPAIKALSDIEYIPEPLNANNSSLVSVHLMGTCPMGEDRAKSAVDSFGKVHGRRGLFINDSSIFCGAVGVNPQGTLMALARRNVAHFLNQ